MIKLLKILLAGLATSLFMFPINIPGWPMNSKMTLALVGLILLAFDKIKTKKFTLNKDFVWISVIAMGVSAMAQLATTYNHTQETTYTDYVMSFWTWMGAAYAVVTFIRKVHQDLNVRLIGNYLIGACVFQCLTAYAVELAPAVKSFVDYFMGTQFAEIDRLYGLGAWLDPSGLRFAAILVITMALIMENITNTAIQILYILAFLVIALIGNMISRTTTIGIILSFVYAIIYSILKFRAGEVQVGNVFISATIFAIGILLVIYLYNNDINFHKRLRFGFEGFFNYFEKNTFETQSTNMLKGMVRWPESLKTWIIGDGYMENPTQDMNYLGPIVRGYYMGTDIGYLRFIFYFGIPGLALMLSMFLKATQTCIKYIPQSSLLFLFLLTANLICWIKVSSDIIMVFCPFLILVYKDALVVPHKIQ